MKPKIILVLSGGGLLGAWQAGAIEAVLEKYQVIGVVGISVGAMAGAAVAQNKFFTVYKPFWETVTDKDMKTRLLLKYPAIAGGKALVLKREGLVSREPLEDLVNNHIHRDDFEIPFLAGSINLHSLQIRYWGYPGSTTDMLRKSVLASATMPLIWKPVIINGEKYVDGGGIDNTPLSEGRKMADKYNPDKIVIINCHNRKPEHKEKIKGLIPIGGRSLRAILSDVMKVDIERFMDFNDIAKQAKDRGIEPMLHPRSRKPLKYYDTLLIEPDKDLGNNLKVERWRYKDGLKTAKRLIG